MIPCYDGFPVEEKRAKIRSALQSNFEGMPKSMQDVLDALEKPAEEPVEPTLESSGFYFNAANPPAFPSDRKLPQLIRLLTSRTPGIYKAAVADAVFPSLGTHLYDTWFKYTDNVKHEATL